MILRSAFLTEIS